MKKRYQDLELLLFKGFIPLKVQINGINLVLKSVNEHEYQNIKLMSGLESDPRFVTLFNINYLFYSIYMVDGMSILKTREDNYSEFVYILKQLPGVFYKSTFSLLEELTRRQSNCSIQVEQYSLEVDSRYNWETKKQVLINSPAITTVSGTDLLGINQFQKYWSALNIREDKREKFEQDYGLAKFLASFQDSKAVRKIEQQEKVKKEEDEKRKERLRVIGTEEEIKYLSDPNDTREGIIKELEKQMAGDKDAHDRFIEEYERKIRKEMLVRLSDMQKVREHRRQEIDEVGDEVRSISKEELQERMARLKERKIKNMEAYESSADQNSKFYQMSNIVDDQLIREEDFISEDDYLKLTGDETFQAITGKKETEKAKQKRLDHEYEKQQKTLAAKFNYDDETLDFPHLKKR